MKAKKTVEQKSFLLPTLAEQLDARRPIYQLAGKIPWGDFEEEFGAFYSEESRPAKAVRLMVGLLILKQLHNLSDETVVEAWRENPYWQYFCGESEMPWGAPCEPSDLVHRFSRFARHRFLEISHFAFNAEIGLVQLGHPIQFFQHAVEVENVDQVTSASSLSLMISSLRFNEHVQSLALNSQ